MHIEKFAKTTTAKMQDLFIAVTKLQVAVEHSKGVPDIVKEASASVQDAQQALSDHLFGDGSE